MDQCYHDITMVISLKANVAVAARTLLLLITDAVHQALLPVYYLFTKACWEIHCSHRGSQTTGPEPVSIVTQERPGTDPGHSM